jgi:hypothetical protein
VKDHTNFALKFVTNAEDHVTAVQVQRSSGIWLPDVVFAPRSTIAYAKLPSGYTFRVIQYWNRVDFYSTELHIVSPDGREQEHTLDGDDNKSWRVPMQIDESNRAVLVTLGGGRKKQVSY